MSSPFWSCSDGEAAQFWEDGFLVVPELFSPEEAELLHRVSKAEKHGQPDENGVQPIMWLFSTHDAADKEDIFNAIVHSRRMVDTMMRLLGDEVYVYHYKMAMKTKENPAAGRNNEWVWHQDYVRATPLSLLCGPSVLRLIAGDAARPRRGTGTILARSIRTSRRASWRWTSARRRTDASRSSRAATSSGA